MPRSGFYLIVDPQHRALGALPPSWWIDDLMRFHGVRYYVGLLSAAALHGAAHHQPQELQVVAGSVLRQLTAGRVRMRFFFRRHIGRAVTEQMKTPTGYIPVSTAETTALDLVRYRKGAGSIDHVATVIAELAERIGARKLVAVARMVDELPVIQRLGYLLEWTGHSSLADGLANLLRARSPRMVPLEPRGPDGVGEVNHRWHLLVNTSIEVET
jgi:predicted transcriptional regulator of viral defense system